MRSGCALGFRTEKTHPPVVPIATGGKSTPPVEPGKHVGKTVTSGAGTDVASSSTLMLFT